VEQLGRYKIEQELGRGAMGIVYRAYDPKIDRIVAIKTITALGLPAGDEVEYRQRFFREARAAGKLSHPGLVTIYDVGELEHTQAPYIVMEYLEGRTLESFISGSSDQPVVLTIDIVRQIAEALHYAHSQGIVHRDIKPANIIVTPQGRAKITDFGIARQAITQLTVPGEALGTPAYMSPEQVRGEPVDGRSDLFSLGIILYSMLAGQNPFRGESATAVMYHINYSEPVPPSQLNLSLDPRFDSVLKRALAKDAADRYQSGQDFAADLEDLRQGRTPRPQASPAAETELETTVRRSSSKPLPIEVLTSSSRSAGGAQGAVVLARQLPRMLREGLENGAGSGVALRLSWKLQLGFALTVALLGLLFYGNHGPAKTARLEIRCVHGFSSGELLVWVDGRLACEARLAGTVKKRLGLIKTVQGSFSDTVALAPGKHTLRVRVVSNTTGYDQTSEADVELAHEGVKALEISFTGRGDNLTLNLR
jgi:serine/threonine protein kinase